MGERLIFLFTCISGICSIVLISVFIQFILHVYKKKKGKSIHQLIQKSATVSLCGYSIFVLMSFILDFIGSLWYIDSINIQYSKLFCQLQTFNIIFFMMGKLATYIYFMSLVHVTFKDSFLHYPPKVIGSLTFIFFSIMCIIGVFYMFFLFLDFEAVDTINSPTDCQQLNMSKSTNSIIWIGSIFDGLWSITCLILFYLRLRKITALIIKEATETQTEIEKFEEQCKLKSVATISTQNETIETLKYEPVEIGNYHAKVSSLSNGDDEEFKSKIQENTNNIERRRSSMFESLQSNFNKIKRKNSIRQNNKQDTVHKFLPIMLKLTILSLWCALSTIILGFCLWTMYPNLASVIDSTINGICVYLSFGFSKRLYETLCLPFISCRNCDKCVTIVKETNRMEKYDEFDSNQQTVLG